MEPDPRVELAELARCARGLGELDRLLGVPCSPVPGGLAPAPAPRAATAGPPAGPARAGVARADDADIRPPRGERPPEPDPRGAPPAGPGAAPSDPDEAPEQLAARRQANERELHALADRMVGCTRCPLHEGRTRLVFGQGDAAAELVFVGEGPGRHEDEQGLAFVGPSGALLTKMIEAMGLTRDEVFIANVVKCRPPRNRAPSPAEMGTCLPALRQQLEVIRPRVICALGRTAAAGLGLIPPDASLGRSRGRFHDWNGVPALITYHPAYLLRQPAEKRKAWHDLQQLFPRIRRRRDASR